MSLVCNSVFLPFYLHWLYSTDITIGFVGLMFKRQQKESPYGKSETVTERVFTKQMFAGQLLLKKFRSDLHEN